MVMATDTNNYSVIYELLPNDHAEENIDEIFNKIFDELLKQEQVKNDPN